MGPAIVDMETTFVTSTLVESNSFTGNGVGGINTEHFGILMSASTGNTLRNNQVTGNSGTGIGVINTTNAVVTGNTVTGTKVLLTGSTTERGAGIILEEDHGTVCTGNTVTGNEGHGIFTWQSDGNLGNEVARVILSGRCSQWWYVDLAGW